jgi:hypothetical protein
MTSKTILIIVIVVVLFIPSNAIAEESRAFTIPENSVQAFEIKLEEGEKITYSIKLHEDDEIVFSLEDPNNKVFSFGKINDFFGSSVLAEPEGIYTFVFDNSISLDESKHLDFEFTISKVKFDVFIDELPNSDIQIGEILEDAFDFWREQYSDLEFNIVETPQQANLNIQFVKDFGTEHIGYALGSSYMEVGLGDNGCRDKWQPYSEKHVTHIVKHELGHILGLEHSQDPNDVMFSVNQGKEYGVIDEEHVFSPGYGQFIPLCTDKEISAFSFKIETNDPEHGFDVYVVPSVESFRDWSSGESFSYYSASGCQDKDERTFFGECHGLTLGSGLLIVTDEEQTSSLTKINIKTREVSSDIDFPQEIVLSNTNIDQEMVDSDKTEPVCGAGTILKDGQCIPNTVETIKTVGDEGLPGGCLIATATYGTELAPQVQQLRELRDNKLLQTESGYFFLNAFNDFYYAFSPYIADYERENPVFKEMVKLAITPMISSLSILNYVDMSSDQEVLVYGISLILLNIGMYFAVPVIVIMRFRK